MRVGTSAGWGGLGGGVGASVCVSSGLSDFAPERAQLSTLLLPALQVPPARLPPTRIRAAVVPSAGGKGMRGGA